MRSVHTLLIVLLASVVLAAGCGGAPTPSQDDVATAVAATLAAQAPTPTEPPAPPTEPPAAPTEPPPPTPGGAVSALEDVKAATIQIRAQGSFVSPEDFGIYVKAGSGSGFIIDPSGIAVTNNHVVTGSALLRVWVGGDTNRTYNARVLGVSECSDLAVIDIEGDGFPYLTWYQGDPNVGLDVYAAGFPLGETEFTLTRGIVAKARADGEWPWASVDNSIEHDANIQPGNSGGPLVSQNGQAVGVNYAGWPGPTGTEQFFAIAPSEALKIIDELRAGRDATSIGVNGEAINTGDISGIWVNSVKSGSPADRAGVRGGDIITTMEGLPLASNGLMTDYCDILRSRSREDVLAIEVLRYASQEVLEGQLNGRELQAVFSFAQQLEDTVQDTGQAVTTAYTDYVAVYDDSGAIGMEVPAQWSDVDGSPWLIDNEQVGASITAAPDVQGFNSTWTVPGAFFGASKTIAQRYNENTLLDVFDFSGDCQYAGRSDYSDPLYEGKYDLYTDCGGQGTTFVVLVAVPSHRAFVALVAIQVVSEADLEALDRILNTFEVVGAL